EAQRAAGQYPDQQGQPHTHLACRYRTHRLRSPARSGPKNSRCAHARGILRSLRCPSVVPPALDSSRSCRTHYLLPACSACWPALRPWLPTCPPRPTAFRWKTPSRRPLPARRPICARSCPRMTRFAGTTTARCCRRRPCSAGTPPDLRPELPADDEIRQDDHSLLLRPEREHRLPANFWAVKKLRYRLARQDGPAPLIFIIAGTGAHYAAANMELLKKVFYQG